MAPRRSAARRRARPWAVAALVLACLSAGPGPAAAQAGCQPSNKTEADALLAFKARLANGATALPDWAPSSPAWSGVGCGSGGQVTSLDLFVKGLQGTVAWGALAQLSKLEALKLSSNSLQGDLGARFPPALQLLDLSDNRINGTIASGALPPQLATLDLSTNLIQGTIPGDLFLPPTLVTADLSDNMLTGILPATLSIPPSLTFLSIWANLLTGTLPAYPGVTGLEVRTIPQSDVGFCGAVPTSPRYMFVNNSAWQPVLSLPSCDNLSQPSGGGGGRGDGGTRGNGTEPEASPEPGAAGETGGAAGETGGAAGAVGSPLPQPEPGQSPPGEEGSGLGGPGGTGALVGSGNKTEIEALMRFKAVLARGSFLDGWSVNQPTACFDWAGVKCDAANQNVEELDLKALGLRGNVSWDTLAQLSSLKSLQLSFNAISGTLGQVLPPAITELQLSHTLLRGTIPTNWALPVNLTTLDLSSNLLSGTIPPGWNASLPAPLADLYLQNNNLQGSLPGWPNLKSLRVYVAPQTGTDFCGATPPAPRYLNTSGSDFSLTRTLTLLPCPDGDGQQQPQAGSPLPRQGGSGGSSAGAPPPEDSGGSSSNTGLIVGAVVGSVCGAALLAGLGIWLWRRGKQQQPVLPVVKLPRPQERSDDTDRPGSTPGTSEFKLDVDEKNGSLAGSAGPAAVVSAGSGSFLASEPSGPASRAPSGAMRADSAESADLGRRRSLASAGSGSTAGGGLDVTPWLFKYEDFEFIKPIGEGSSARVFVARWREAIVAVKVFNVRGLGGPEEAADPEAPPSPSITLSNPILDVLRKESSLLASLRHPHIVSFLGVVTVPPCLVSEYCSRGSLAHVLQQAARAPDPAAVLSWPRRLQMLLDAAKGMVYLHSCSPPVIHRDLKSPNLLVDKHFRVKVSDFNLSKLMEDSTVAAQSSQTINNPRWLAPEILEAGASSAASDVYAFGLVMWEMLAMRLPWENDTTWSIVKIVTGGGRPEVPPPDKLLGGDFSVREGYVALMEQCWAQEAAARPSFTQVTVALRTLHGHCNAEERARRSS